MTEYVLGSVFGYTFFVEGTTNQAQHGQIFITNKYAAGATGQTWVKYAGTWKPATTYVKHSGTWKVATAYVKSGGTWKQV